MKKLLFILSFLFFVLIGKSQITTPTKISSGGIQPARYSDTTAANNVNGVKNIAGNLIITSDNILWQRNSTATGWIAAGGSSSTNIYNIYNTSITNVSIINQSDTTITYEICTGAGACDTLVAVTNVTYKIGAQVSFIDSAHIQICGIDSATQVSSCDTFSIPAQKLYVFQNGTQEPSAGVVEGGGNLSHTLTYNMNSNVASFLNGTLQYQDAGATYAGGNVLTSDINGNASWQPIPGQGASGGTYIISGLNVVWDSLLTFDVTAGTYMINGVLYHSNFTVVTLDTLIGTDPRRDEIIADTLGVVSKITGTPSSDPAAPTPNPLSQIGITDVLINAGDNVPANVTQGFIYNEGTGTAGGEWDTASSISAARFRNTAHPYNGTYDLYVPSFTNKATITFTNNTTVDLSAFTSVSYAIRLNSAFFAIATYLSLRWYNGNTAVSNAINVRTGNYGWVRTTINNYQHVAVPMSAFTFSSYTANKLVITLAGGNSSGFYFDYLQLQSNVGQPPTGNGLIGLQVANFSPLFNSTTTITNNLANVTYSAQNATAYRVFGNFTNTSAAPTFGQIDLGTSVVTGLLPVTNLSVAPANYYLGSLDGVTNQWLPLASLYDSAYVKNWLRTKNGAVRDTIVFGSPDQDSALLSYDTYVGLNTYAFHIQDSSNNDWFLLDQKAGEESSQLFSTNGIGNSILNLSSFPSNYYFQLSSSTGSTNTSILGNYILGEINISADSAIYLNSRINQNKENVASANNLTLTRGGNIFQISGTTQINLIDITGWTAGTIVTLVFESNVTVKNNQAPSGLYYPIYLSGGADFSATAGDVLTLLYGNTFPLNAGWREVSRTTF